MRPSLFFLEGTTSSSPTSAGTGSESVFILCSWGRNDGFSMWQATSQYHFYVLPESRFAVGPVAIDQHQARDFDEVLGMFGAATVVDGTTWYSSPLYQCVDGDRTFNARFIPHEVVVASAENRRRELQRMKRGGRSRSASVGGWSAMGRIFVSRRAPAH